MAPYYLIVLTTFLLSVFDLVKSNVIRLLVYVVYCTVLILFVGLRTVGVDNDSVNYEEAFNLAGGMSWPDLITGNYEETMERGYLLLNKAVYALGGGIRTVFLLMAVVTGLVNYTLIYRKSPFPFASLLLYVCFFYFYRDFTQIRFALSAGLGLWALFLLTERDYIKFALLVLIGASFHSAILVVPFIGLVYMLTKNYWFYFILPLIGAVGAFFDPVMFLFSLGGLPPTLAQYVELEEFGRGGYVISIIAQVFMTGMLIFKSRLLKCYPKKVVDYLFVALSIASFINLLFISFAIMQRLALLLFGAILFSMPYVSKVLETRKSDRFLALFLRFVFMLYILYYGLKMVSPSLMQPYSIM
ncbi:EpsG family protein [Parapedobacter sp. DT-150]|uniref:EpsG family protein n=1 Tax=Parapedobacter sp. DT-150 TaxID=3396162 RepID=UPI003F197401